MIVRYTVETRSDTVPALWILYKGDIILMFETKEGWRTEKLSVCLKHKALIRGSAGTNLELLLVVTQVDRKWNSALYTYTVGPH